MHEIITEEYGYKVTTPEDVHIREIAIIHEDL